MKLFVQHKFKSIFKGCIDVVHFDCLQCWGTLLGQNTCSMHFQRTNERDIIPLLKILPFVFNCLAAKTVLQCPCITVAVTLLLQMHYFIFKNYSLNHSVTLFLCVKYLY